eukprot:GHVT01087524.1.p2 GENE.GHVT01087524.1~~GHVT01087524.1.p2  ORF type:complete len:497 (+),score=95.69 GHVT01087524.1:232-1722(+)
MSHEVSGRRGGATSPLLLAQPPQIGSPVNALAGVSLPQRQAAVCSTAAVSPRVGPKRSARKEKPRAAHSLGVKAASAIEPKDGHNQRHHRHQRQGVSGGHQHVSASCCSPSRVNSSSLAVPVPSPSALRPEHAGTASFCSSSVSIALGTTQCLAFPMPLAPSHVSPRAAAVGSQSPGRGPSAAVAAAFATRAVGHQPPYSPRHGAISDYRLLAAAACRSGHLVQASSALYNLAMLQMERKETNKALKTFYHLLQVAEAMPELKLQTLAHSFLGILHQEQKNLEASIFHHNKQLTLSETAQEKFVAHSNLGIVFMQMGLSEHGSIHHQHAVEIAHRLHSKEAQAAAVGNLGLAAMEQGDLKTTRMCLQYHLRSITAASMDSKTAQSSAVFLSSSGLKSSTRALSPAAARALPQRRAAEEAAKSRLKGLQHLGEVAAGEGKLKEAHMLFDQVLRDAEKLDVPDILHTARVALGVVRGKLQLSEQLSGTGPLSGRGVEI